MSERGDRIRAASAHIAQYGFQTRRSTPEEVNRWGPFRVHDTPDECTVYAEGFIEGVHVDLFEYSCTTTDTEGTSSTSSTLLAIAAHPWVSGSAGITIDFREWSTGGAIFGAVWDVLTWFPPFILLKVVQHVNESANPDRVVGHPEFDRLYCVRADSEAAAMQAIPESLRNALVNTSFQGKIELRPGYILLSEHSAYFDPQGTETTLRYLTTFLKCFHPPASAHPMR